ncbi:flagellar basal-body rod protein FlgF [Tranquillimonas alkanivorans]|uniref:Flagellar basal-body rod protein FlgF n=1 Tax=Tranquillimonas alkanivorans TaxID=441119 RepID=A0A1I5S575_9RHOB|nr:flagellar basal-body rod protein FlgF [Tranquillimonas alkanivorans]SFP65814.1 flagellar basal-body rod protein FlgF [Tranquillimonas alkanivorans]
MDNSTYVSISLASAMRRALEVSANNMANANTAGFKGERVVFESYMHTESGSGDGTSFVLDKGSYLDGTQGTITHTGNPLDVAVQGDGWLSYLTPTGQRAYGRDGHLTVDAQGNLMTLSGARVLDAGGGPIALPPDLNGEVTISADGAITTPQGDVIAALGLFDVPEIQSFERIGAGMFVPPGEGDLPQPVPAIGTTVVQGAVEGSNVEPIVEMTRMMDIQKAYERSVKLMGSEDDLRKDALRRLGQTT